MRHAHALHNENACDFLLADGRFNDWVVTTAFYSALHFAHHELFPGVHDGVHYDTPGAYFRGLRKRITDGQSAPLGKHAATIRLVRRRLPFYQEYNWLYNNCMTARYIDYQVDGKKANYARCLLRTIKSRLSKPLT
jgi:hypothetical protein